MARICVMNVAGVSGRLLGRDKGLWMNSLASPPRAMLATFPAVAASVQASMTTGVAPGAHGVVAPTDQCILAATCELPATASACVTDLPAILQQVLFEGAGRPAR